MLHSIAFLLIWIKGKGPTSSFLGLFILQGPTSGRGHAVGPRLGGPWISWSRDYREDADSVQALASDWSTQITWRHCPPLIGQGWRMQMVTGGQTLGSLRLGVNTAGACLESQGRDPGPRMSPWGHRPEAAHPDILTSLASASRFRTPGGSSCGRGTAVHCAQTDQTYSSP